MITIDEYPYTVHTTGNPAVWTILARDAAANDFYWKGVRSELLAAVDTNLPNGSTLTITWSEPLFGPTISIEFTARTTPSAVDEIPANPADYGSYLEYWEAVAAKIQAHPSIFPWLKAYATDNGPGHSLWVEVLAYDEDWTVAITDPLLADISIVPHNTLSTNFPPNYKVFIEVMIESTWGGQYTRAAILEGIPGTDSKVRFNVANVLHSYIKDSIESWIPAWDVAIPYKPDTVRHYYIRVWENVGEVDEDYDGYTQSDPFICVLGGLSSSMASQVDFFGSMSSSSSLLSFFPDKKTIDEVSPEWLPWYNYLGEDATPGIEVVVYYSDGDEYTFTQYMEDIIVQPKQIALLPISYRLLSVLVFSPLIYKIKIRVVNGSTSSFTEVSDWRNFLVDHDYYESVRYLMYLNSFFMPTALICPGDFEKELEVDRAIAKGILSSSLPTFGRNFQFQQDWEEVFTYQTSYLSEAQSSALQECLIYGLLWEITESAYTQLVLRAKSFRISSTRNNLRAYALEATKSITEFWYTPSETMASIAGSILVDDEGDALVDDEGGVLSEG